MLSISVWLWIILTIILILVPVGILSFFFSQKILKVIMSLIGKISTFDVLTKFKKEIIHLYKHPEYKEKKEVLPSEEQSSFNNGIDELIKPRYYHLKSSEPEGVPPNEENKVILIKKKKMLEKIIYDALGLRKDGKLNEYEQKIIEGLAIDSEDKDLNKLLADLYFTTSNYKKALPILKKIIEIDPNDHKAIWQIGEVYLTSSDFSVAELLIQKAITMNPSNPKYYISMVELFYNTDRKHDAIKEMEKVIKLRPSTSAYMIALADLYQEVNDFDNAKKYYFRVLEYEPSNEKVKKTLKELVSSATNLTRDE